MFFVVFFQAMCERNGMKLIDIPDTETYEFLPSLVNEVIKQKGSEIEKNPGDTHAWWVNIKGKQAPDGIFRFYNAENNEGRSKWTQLFWRKTSFFASLYTFHQVGFGPLCFLGKVSMFSFPSGQCLNTKWCEHWRAKSLRFNKILGVCIPLFLWHPPLDMSQTRTKTIPLAVPPLPLTGDSCLIRKINTK